MKRAWISLVACVWLVGCALAPRLADDQRTKIKTVGVVSLIGDKLQRVHVGFMVLNHRYSEHVIDDWKLDEKAEVAAVSLLSGYQAAPLLVDRGALRKVHTGDDHRPLDFDLARNELRAATANRPVDVVVVLAKHPSEDGISNSGQSLEGVGLYSRAIGQRVQIVAPYVWYSVTVLDGVTLKPIARRNAFMPNPNPGTFGPKIIPPFRQLDLSANPNAFNNVTDRDSFNKLVDSDKRIVQQALEEILRDSLKATLNGLGFSRH